MRATKDSTGKIAISMMSKTLDRIDKRATKHSLSTSYVIDRDLSRFYSLIESEKTIGAEYLTKEQLKIFTNTCQNTIDASSVRTMAIKTLRSYIMDMFDAETKLYDNLNELEDIQFLVLLDSIGI